ncbi:MAG: DUF4157 domain-containing protein, partial [Myxococcota bacterium]
MRVIERLMARGHLPDAIERYVAGWMREDGRGPDDVPAVVRMAGLPEVMMHRIHTLAFSFGSSPTPSLETRMRPLAMRDGLWFDHLNSRADAVRFAIPAMDWLNPVPAARAPELAPPGVYSLQRDASDARAGGPMPRAADILRRLGVGRPLPAAVQATLGPRLAALGRPLDLGPVMVHAGAEADRLCRELRANAFAIGRHIAFRAGRYRPDDDDGLELLAHELTHVWQQSTQRVPATGGLRSDPGLEAEADAVGARVASDLGRTEVGHAPDAPADALEAAPHPGAAAAIQACPSQPDTSRRRRGGQATPAATGRAPRSRALDGLVGEARRFVEAEGMLPAAIFIVADAITAYDATFHARGRWAISAPVPLTPGFWFDGGAAIERWSGLTASDIQRITAGRADDLWVVGAQHAQPADAATPPAPAARRPASTDAQGGPAHGARAPAPAATAAPTTTPAPDPTAPYRLQSFALDRVGDFRGGATNHPPDHLGLESGGVGFSVAVRATTGAELPPGHVLGLLQTLHASRRVAIYKKDGRDHARFVVTRGRMMDQDDSQGAVPAPWYNGGFVAATGADSVAGEDMPKVAFPRTGPDDAVVARTEGSESFITWGVMQRPDGTLDRLAWAAWSVDWGGSAGAGGTTWRGGRLRVSRRAHGPGAEPVTSGPTPNSGAPGA